MGSGEFDASGIDEIGLLWAEVDRREFDLDLRAARSSVLTGMVARGAAPSEDLIYDVFPSLDTSIEPTNELEYANEVLRVFGLPRITQEE